MDKQKGTEGWDVTFMLCSASSQSHSHLQHVKQTLTEDLPSRFSIGTKTTACPLLSIYDPFAVFLIELNKNVCSCLRLTFKATWVRQFVCPYIINQCAGITVEEYTCINIFFILDYTGMSCCEFWSTSRLSIICLRSSCSLSESLQAII